jgi:hypothetical protein
MFYYKRLYLNSFFYHLVYILTGEEKKIPSPQINSLHKIIKWRSTEPTFICSLFYIVVIVDIQLRLLF